MVLDSKTKITIKRSAKKEKKRKSIEDDDSEITVPVVNKRLDLTNAHLREIATELGTIHLSFPENVIPSFEGQTEFPSSYCTLNAKEKLLLVFAENFRQQFNAKYPTRKPQILAVYNECHVQV